MRDFYHIFPSLWGEMICEISPWLKFEIIGLFVDTWTADYQYPLPDCENLAFPILIKSSYKQKTFSAFFIPFMEPTSNFEHFQKKDDRHSQCISEINHRLRLDHADHYSAPSQNILRQSTISTVPNTSKIFMRALLPYFSITARRNDLGNISLIEFWNHRVVC